MFLAHIGNSRFKSLAGVRSRLGIGNSIIYWIKHAGRRIQSEESESDVNKLFSVQLEDTKVTERMFYRLQISEVITCTLAVAGFGCAAISHDLNSIEPLSENQFTILKTLIILTSILTSLLILSIYWRTQRELKWEKAKGIYNHSDDLLTTGKYLNCILEIIANFIHPIWAINSSEFSFETMRYEITASYKYNDILTLIMLCRVYHIIRVISILSYYRSTRAQRLCQINGSYAGTSFSIKSQMNENPLFFLTLMLVLPILMAAFSLRILERPTESYTGMRFSEFENCLWCAVVTFTTVGFGDYAPETLGGRAVVMFTALWGVMYVSLMTAAFTHLFTMDSGQEKSLKIIKRLNYKDKLRNLAAFLLSSVARYKYMKKHEGYRSIDRVNQLLRFRHYLNLFRNLRMKQRNLYDFDSFEDRLQRKMNNQIENHTLLSEIFVKIEYVLKCIENKVNK